MYCPRRLPRQRMLDLWPIGERVPQTPAQRIKSTPDPIVAHRARKCRRSNSEASGAARDFPECGVVAICRRRPVRSRIARHFLIRARHSTSCNLDQPPGVGLSRMHCLEMLPYAGYTIQPATPRPASCQWRRGLMLVTSIPSGFGGKCPEAPECRLPPLIRLQESIPESPRASTQTTVARWCGG
jgi:hypothetical protein